jgi:hypothetical protein
MQGYGQTVTIYLAKATESLLSAESEFVNGRYNYQPELVTATQARRALRRTRLFVTTIRQRGGVAQ